MKMVAQPADAPFTLGICNSAWGRNDCPNKAEVLLVNTRNSGFAVMCGPHRDAFARSGAKYEGLYVEEPYTEARDLELRARVAAEEAADKAILALVTPKIKAWVQALSEQQPEYVTHGMYAGYLKRGPGIYVSPEGFHHFNVPELCEMVDLELTDENRDMIVNLLAEMGQDIGIATLIRQDRTQEGT